MMLISQVLIILAIMEMKVLEIKVMDLLILMMHLDQIKLTKHLKIEIKVKRELRKMRRKIKTRFINPK